MAYFLVLMRDVAPGSSAEVDHEPFVDALVARNLILLGGDFVDAPSTGVTSAYVLRCADLAAAESTVAGDPLVTTGACEPVVAEWDLVGINLAAVDPDLTSPT
jgi:uncharacterized protein YciI